MISPAKSWWCCQLDSTRPVLLDWSTRHDHLREVTREDILTSTDSLHGSKRHHTSASFGRCFGTAKDRHHLARSRSMATRMSVFSVMRSPLPLRALLSRRLTSLRRLY
jgi:hypothetical protein